MANKESNYGGSFSETGKIGGEYKGEDASAVQDSAGLGQVHETSPEMLQNTPSNIARLEDVIEHNKGRQKYLKQTRSPSDGEDIRWYFCKVPLAVNELAASVPRTEIIGKSEYFRFSVRDSLALEASFLEREDELLSGWWKEYAECSEGPNGLPRSSTVTADAQPNLSDTEVSQSTELYEEERVGVPVKGGLYEVDLAKRHSFPVYWHGENRRVLRGHWFARKNGLDWLPLREDVAEQLELAYRCQVWHRRTFQPSGLFAARVDLQGTTQGLHALFTGEDDTWEAWLGVDASGFSIGLRGNGIKLRRGFSVFDSLKSTQDELRQQKEEEMDDYCAQVPVRHLVFMVHGIGQRLEKANLVDDVGDFRKITAGLAEQHLTSYQRNHQRVLFIPCQWRRGLKLSGESAVEKITLEGVRGLRVMLSATVHDVLYYMSPIYCQDIIDSVSNQLNRLYMKFIKRNPGYDGKVSIYGHSLGSVLSYDILCHQESLRSPFPIDGMYTGKVRNEESHVVATDQSAPECSIASLEEQTAKRDDQTSMLVSALESTISSSQLDAAVHEERAEDIFLTVDPSSTSQEEEISIKAYATTGPMEQSYASLRETENFTKSNDTASSECVQELNHDCGDTYSLNRKSLDAEPCINSQIHDADTVTIAENKYEDTRDKDKVITSLKEEVNSLKAKLAELESCYKDGKTNSQESFQGDKIENVTPRPSSSEELSTGKDDSRKSYTPYIKYTKLKFKVDTFFAVGSPLGVFLALRNIRIGIGKGQEYWQDEQIREGMPLCRRMFNIFHPFDPVAYRVEPLVCKEYISKRPVMIPYHKGGKRLHIGFQEFTEDLAARSQAIVKHLNSMRVKMVNMLQPRNKDKVEAIEDVKEGEERTYGSIMMQRLTGSEDGRIDHVLQDKTFEHAYISAIGAHTNYWRDHDTALFIFKHLYRDIPEDAETSEARSKQRKPAGLIYQTDTLDEDLPLTFSDTALVREFQWKAKKTMGIS